MGNLLLVIVIIAAAVFYFRAISPQTDKKRRRKCQAFAQWDYAHRGLWDLELQIPENSLPAFSRAIREKAAIELDVRMTKDNQLVVIHDSSLKRLCGVEKTVETSTYADLASLSLSGTEYAIPLFGQVLRLVQGRVPLLIEIKTVSASDTDICSYLYKELEFYSGPYMVQSFNPFTLRWFSQHAPQVLTGQLGTGFPDLPERNPVLRAALWLLLFNLISRPDFISYNLHYADCISVRINQFLYRTPVFVWTVRSMNEYRQGTAQYSTVIFENFIP